MRNAITPNKTTKAATPGRTLMSRIFGLKYIPPLFTAVCLILIWQFGVKLFGVPTYIAPAPSDVGAVLVSEFGLLLLNFWPTLYESVFGFIFGNLFGIMAAIIFVHFKKLDAAFFPLAVFVNTIPILAIAPILVLIFGNGLTAKVIIASLICFFPTLVNMVRGLQAVNPQMLELARILSASKAEVFWMIRLQMSLPYLFSALRIASTTCVIGAIVGEWIGADAGLGALIIDATFNFRAPLLYATVFVSSGLAVFLFTSVIIAEKLIIRWKPAEAV